MQLKPINQQVITIVGASSKKRSSKAELRVCTIKTVRHTDSFAHTQRTQTVKEAI